MVSLKLSCNQQRLSMPYLLSVHWPTIRRNIQFLKYKKPCSSIGRCKIKNAKSIIRQFVFKSFSESKFSCQFSAVRTKGWIVTYFKALDFNFVVVKGKTMQIWKFQLFRPIWRNSDNFVNYCTVEISHVVRWVFGSLGLWRADTLLCSTYLLRSR
jgi:hypothetical protein